MTNKSINWANLFTYLRIIILPFIILCLFFPDNLSARMVAFVLYTISGVSDYLDGWFARKFNMHSALGTMLDPIADKLMICVILMMLIATKDIANIHIIAAMLILGREFFISGLREFLASDKITIPVSTLAKWKTTFQILALGFLVIGGASKWVHPAIPSHDIGIFLLWSASILTIYTGYEYIKGALKEKSLF